MKNTTHYSPPVEEFALNVMRNAGPGAQAMSLTPDRGQEGNTLARLPTPLPHTATIHTPLPISRAAEDVKIPIVPPTGCEHVPLQPSLNRRTAPPYVRLRFQT